MSPISVLGQTPSFHRTRAKSRVGPVNSNVEHLLFQSSMTAQGRKHVFAGWGSSRSMPPGAERRLTARLLPDIGLVANGSSGRGAAGRRYFAERPHLAGYRRIGCADSLGCSHGALQHYRWRYSSITTGGIGAAYATTNGEQTARLKGSST